VEGIAMIIGVDRFLDMVRTAVNVTGDSAVSVIVAKSEKLLNLEIFHNKKLNAENDPV
jgi:Na+/H+-dicarboxylate symporter